MPEPLKTRICDLFQIEHPVVLAGMGGASTPELAAAVSNAGGLGVLGAAACGPTRLRNWIRRTRELTDKPFGVDTLLPASVRRQQQLSDAGERQPQLDLEAHQEFARSFMAENGLELSAAAPRSDSGAPDNDGLVLFSEPFFKAQMEVIIEERVPVYAAGLGNPGPWMDRLKANNTKVMSVVGAVRHAVQVASSGIDVIVAQGHDAGGHNSPVGTMALIPQVVDAMGDIPVLAAGGIADGRGLAASLMLGAAGVWVGSAFLASREAGIHDFQKQALVDASEESTVITRSITGKPCRVLRSSWTEAWKNSELQPLPMPYQSMISDPVMNAAVQDERSDVYPGIAGQGIGMIRSVRPAAEILGEVVTGAREALARTSTAGVV
jgi:NAD(P)H-dependent flavin oxidoreductase YrpB (nitropropane dioxygenase family)